MFKAVVTIIAFVYLILFSAVFSAHSATPPEEVTPTLPTDLFYYWSGLHNDVRTESLLDRDTRYILRTEIGEAAGDIVQLDENGLLPAVDGSQLLNLTKTQVGLTYVENIKHAYAQTIDPPVTADSSIGYAAGRSLWIKTDGTIYTCTDDTVNAAIWDKMPLSVGDITGLQTALDGKEASGAAAAVQGNLDAHTGTHLPLTIAALITAINTQLGGSVWQDDPAAAVSTHAGLPDPHTGYMLESNIGTGANNYIQLDGNGDIPFALGADTSNFNGQFSNDPAFDTYQEIFDWLDDNGGGVTFSVSGLPGVGSIIYRTDLNLLVANNGGTLYTSAFTQADESPTAFVGTFLADTDVATSTLSTAAEKVNMAGLGPLGAPISITQLYSCEYQIDAAAWTAAAGRTYNGEVVGIRQVSSATGSTQQDCVLTAGDQTDTYSVTTGIGSAVLFEQHFEGTDDADRFNPLTGTPAGYVPPGGDTTPTIVQTITTDGVTYRDGAYALSAPTRQDYLIYDSSTVPLYNSDQGTAEVWVYFDTALNSNTIFLVMQGVEAQDVIRFEQVGPEVQIYYDTNASTNVSVTTGAAGMVPGNWYKVVGRWDINGVNTLSIEVYDSSATLLDSVTTNAALQAWTTAENTLNVGFFNYVDPFYPLFVDGVKIYDSW